MKNNMLELKDFITYFQSLFDADRNGKIRITINHENENLVLKFFSNSGISIDTFHCTKELYNKIVYFIYMNFIYSNKILIASKNGENYSIKSSNIEIISKIDEELQKKLSDEAFKKMKQNYEDKSTKRNLSEFEKVSNFFRIYSMYLKRCLNKENRSDIKISYVNGVYEVSIINNGEIIFSRNISCNEIKSRRLNKIICENMIDENSIILSSITADNKLKIQTPKFCLTIPYNNSTKDFHDEALKKMNEYNFSSQMLKVKSSNR